MISHWGEAILYENKIIFSSVMIEQHWNGIIVPEIRVGWK